MVTVTLSDCVKKFYTFEGEFGKYVSCTNREQAILNGYEIVIGEPLYRSMVSHIDALFDYG